MDDGRKWSRIPIVRKTIAADFFEKDFLPQIPDANCHEIGFGPDISKPYRAMRKLAWNYYERLADDYDNIGVIMEDDGLGRLKAKTALRRRRDENTTYYYGPSDARRSNIFTLARDMEGDANDLADFNDIVAILEHFAGAHCGARET